MIRSKALVAIAILLLCINLGVGSIRAAGPALHFSQDSLGAQTGNDFTIDITIDTTGKSISGAGAKILYDPYYLTGVSIHTSTLFADYPAAIIDNPNGVMTISGIAASPSDVFVGTGTFATVTFRPNHPGTTHLNFDFTPGSTKDSNLAVMSDVGDILSDVNSLTVTMTEGSPTTQDTGSSFTETVIPALQAAQGDFLKTVVGAVGLTQVSDKYAAARPGRPALAEAMQQDPLGPIIQQPPITDASNQQPAVNVVAVRNVRWLLFAIAGAIILALIAAIAILVRRLKFLYTASQLPPISTPLRQPTPPLPQV